MHSNVTKAIVAELWWSKLWNRKGDSEFVHVTWISTSLLVEGTNWTEWRVARKTNKNTCTFLSLDH